MGSRRLKLIYPPELVNEPVLYELIQQFGLLPNVRRADAGPQGGWLIVDLRGEDSKIEQALEWVRRRGIRVEENPK